MSDNSYWGVHTRTILQLQELGYRFKLHDRLPIFQLWISLIRKAKKSPKLQGKILMILQDLDYLKALRCEGLEPERLSKNKYKPISG